MYRDDENLLEDVEVADRQTLRRNRPPQAYSARFDRQKASVLGSCRRSRKPGVAASCNGKPWSLNS